MTDKLHSDEQEKLEQLLYSPGLQDTTDLETGTRVINTTSEPSGLGSASFSAALTLSRPTDTRLAVKRICARLAVTIDTIPSGDTDLYCRVYVDAQDTAHRLFDINWNSTGAKATAIDAHSSALATIFGLLGDGTTHTFYFFFWKAGTGTGITISLVQLWEGVGSKIAGAGTPCFSITHTGLISGFMVCSKAGSGSATIRLCQGIQDSTYLWYLISTTNEAPIPLTMGINFGLAINTSFDTDIAYLVRIFLTLRNEN
jgi:hypothetical protein